MENEYRKIFEKEVGVPFKKEIAIYEKDEHINIIQPLSHNCKEKCEKGCTHDCYKSLGEVMRRNLLFYCYGEDELVRKYNNIYYMDLVNAVKMAYKNRIPKRKPNQDGLPSEVLLDAIIQVIYPEATKLAVRTIFRQNDNNEIKGYDLTYFTNSNGHISFWLGQAKMGAKEYCKRGILSDLEEKYKSLYLAEQIYFMADKACQVTEKVIDILDVINQLNALNINMGEEQQADKLLKYFETNRIEIIIPCLLVYEKSKVYQNVNQINRMICEETKWMKKHFDKVFQFEKIHPQLIFIFLPIENLEGLRGEEGFYDKLH